MDILSGFVVYGASPSRFAFCTWPTGLTSENQFFCNGCRDISAGFQEKYILMVSEKADFAERDLS